MHFLHITHGCTIAHYSQSNAAEYHLVQHTKMIRKYWSTHYGAKMNKQILL
ncbi:hypothetical protein DAI22_09g027700 [Oryza sativa Japonica Group]|nr:hypothetical protein DAI22_09g027700 [Oryza sativa Japonica Group]